MIAVCVAIATRLLAADRCNSWAGRAGMGQYDLFARHRTARRHLPIGTTHMQAEQQQNNPSCGSIGRVLSASNTRDIF